MGDSFLQHTYVCPCLRDGQTIGVVVLSFGLTQRVNSWRLCSVLTLIHTIQARYKAIHHDAHLSACTYFPPQPCVDSQNIDGEGVSCN